MISSSRSSWRRNASSKTVGSTSLGRNAGRVPAFAAGAAAAGPRAAPGAVAAPCAGASSVEAAPGSRLARSVMDWLFDGRDGDGVEDGADGRLAGDALGLALEVQDDAMPERWQGDGPDVVRRHIEAAIEQGVDLACRHERLSAARRPSVADVFTDEA